MVSICLRSSSNIVSGLGKGVGDGEGVYQDVFFFFFVISLTVLQLQQNMIYFLVLF